VATLTDSKLKPFFHGDRVDKFDFDLGVIAGHHHVFAFRKLDCTGDIGRPKVKLRTIAGKEWAMATAFLFGEAVDLAFEPGVRGDGTRFCEDLPAFDLFLVDTAQKEFRCCRRPDLLRGFC